MFDLLRRTQLQKEGLCGRMRRKGPESSFLGSLRCDPMVSALIMIAFVAAVVGLLQVAGGLVAGVKRADLTDMLYAVALACGALVHLHVGHRYLRQDNRHLALVLGTLVLHLSCLLLAIRYGQAHWPMGLLVLMMPHALAPLVLSVLMGRRLGLFAMFHASMIGAVVCLPVTSRVSFLAASAIVGMLSVVATRRVRRRTHLFMAGCYVGIGMALFALTLGMVSSTLLDATWAQLFVMPLASGVFTGMAVSALLPVLEAVFGVTTEISWLELADLNHPLMRRLSMEAPGTYHHSLMMANLAEAAAETIGANPTMCRVCAYFHDIGKLTKPEYFVENMGAGENPHRDLTSRMSALVLVAHVKDGVDLALQHKLNDQIIDVIEQHHGTSLTWYFYRQALDQKAEMVRRVAESKATEDDVPDVSEEVFRYPGPKPQFRESAIISLADAVESASRSLDKPNASRIEAMIDELVWNRLMDGQLDECDLTIADLAQVKRSFVKSLLSMMHSRIKYQTARVDDDPVPDGKVVSIDSGKRPPTGQFSIESQADESAKRGSKKRGPTKPTSAA